MTDAQVDLCSTKDISGTQNQVKSGSRQKTGLTEVHLNKLSLQYGINSKNQQIKALIKSGHLKSIQSTEELQSLLLRDDVVGTGIFIKYPNDSGSFTVRLDEPLQKDGKEVKYLRRAEELNHLYVPLGLELDKVQELYITEGEIKSLAGSLKGLPVVGLSGIYNWRTQGQEAELLADGEKLTDSEALISELKRDWKGKRIVLIYDSDITRDHLGYPAFQRLAEQLYRQDAEEVKIITLPSLDEKAKTCLDDYLLAKGEDGPEELKKIIVRADPYLPLGDGAESFAERLIRSDNLENKLKATVAYLGCKAEFITREWLKGYINRAEDRGVLIRDAKAKLAQIPKRNLGPRRAPPRRNSKLDPIYDQPLAMLKGTRYTIDEHGCLCREKIKRIDGEDTFINEPLCNFVPFPSRQVSKDNGLEIERFLEIEGIAPDGEFYLPAMVPLTTFANMGWVATCWGAQAAIEVGMTVRDGVRHAIQMMVSKEYVPKETVYTHLGWRKIDGKWAYLHAGGVIGGPLAQVEPHKRLLRYVLPETVDNLKDALRASLALLDVAPREITIPLLALVFLAPLCEPLRVAGIEPGFMVWMFGQTGSMKSTLAALFLSHFGRFDNKSLPASFRDTAASLESVTFGAKDILLVIDDFYPPHSFREREKLEGVAQQLTRAYGDRTGRGRMTSSLTARASYPPRGMALATGEEIPLGESTMARHFILELPPGSVLKDKLGKAQANRSLLSQAMRGYLEHLAPQLDSLPQELLQQFEQLRERAQKENGHPRLPEAVAQLYIGFNCFLDFCISQQVLSEEEGAKLAEEAWKILNQIVQRQSEVLRDQQPVYKFFRILQDLLAQRRVYLANLENEVPPDAAHLLPEKRIGWQGEGVAYLSMDAALGEVYRHCRSQGEIFPVQKLTLLKHIKNAQLIEQIQGEGKSKDKDRSYTIQKRFGDEKARVLPIPAQLLEVE